MRESLHNFGRLMAAAFLATVAGAATGCAAEIDDEEEEGTVEQEASAYRAGVNGKGCKRSPYNCHLNPGNGQRVTRADGEERWATDPSWSTARGYVDPVSKKPVVPVVDGNGDEMGRSTYTRFTLNYGQTRHMKGRTYVYALSTGLKSGGWVPIDAFRATASLRRRVGEVNARGKNLKKMACYEVATGYPRRLDNFKVVRGSTDADAQEPDDYLPQKRANGKVYVNLAFSAPGDGLGAPAVDMFPAGTKFQRLDVPTWDTGRPSLDVTLYAKPSGSRRYTRPAGDMKFIYGYLKSDLGHVRYGWMALDGLKVSRGCPND